MDVQDTRAGRAGRAGHAGPALFVYTNDYKCSIVRAGTGAAGTMRLRKLADSAIYTQTSARVYLFI